MKRHLLFFDIDGTLIAEGDEPRSIPESAKEAINLAKENGHLCFLNTGRSVAELEPRIRELPMDGWVCGCGTYICCHGEELYHKIIPEKERYELIQDLNKCNLEWLLEGKEDLYYSNRAYETHIGDFQETHKTLVPNALHFISDDATNLCYDKFCICTKDSSDYASFYEKYKDRYTFIDRGNHFFEIIPVDHSKASGIEFLMDRFDVEKEQTIAIGDSTNDLPMLEFAGISIAMKESSEPVLKTASFITDSLEKDGIYKALKHFHLF